MRTSKSLFFAFLLLCSIFAAVLYLHYRSVNEIRQDTASNIKRSYKVQVGSRILWEHDTLTVIDYDFSEGGDNYMLNNGLVMSRELANKYVIADK